MLNYNSTSTSSSSSSNLNIDALSYIVDVFETVFVPLIPGYPQLHKTIRTALYKKLLLDNARQELATRSISNFEDLNEFIIENFRRVGLLIP